MNTKFLWWNYFKEWLDDKTLQNVWNCLYIVIIALNWSYMKFMKQSDRINFVSRVIRTCVFINSWNWYRVLATKRPLVLTYNTCILVNVPMTFHLRFKSILHNIIVWLIPYTVSCLNFTLKFTTNDRPVLTITVLHHPIYTYKQFD